MQNTVSEVAGGESNSFRVGFKMCYPPDVLPRYLHVMRPASPEPPNTAGASDFFNESVPLLGSAGVCLRPEHLITAGVPHAANASHFQFKYTEANIGVCACRAALLIRFYFFSLRRGRFVWTCSLEAESPVTVLVDRCALACFWEIRAVPLGCGWHEFKPGADSCLGVVFDRFWVITKCTQFMYM